MGTATRRTEKSRSNPYCAFQGDKSRLLALVSRDVRYVLVILVITLGGYEIPWSGVMQLLRYVS